MPPLIALLTDFGMGDAYVGTMKGVMLGILPDARLVDLTHEIPPQDVRAGAYALGSACLYFPSGTVFCAVVDPGVGGTRRAIAVRLSLDEKRFDFVAPDNGLLTPLLDAGEVEAAVELHDPRHRLAEVSATFHGRDIFAPAAAHLAAGVPLTEFGPGLDPKALVRITGPKPQRRSEGWQGEVIYADRFGNLITNLPAEVAADGDWRVCVSGVTIPRVSRTFADVAADEALAYVGSSGLLELALRNGDARASWGVAAGDVVTLTPATRRHTRKTAE